MAGNRNKRSATVTDTDENATSTEPIDGEQPLDGMPEPDAEKAVEEEAKAKRQQVPAGLRPLFNEIARLSGFLAIARRAVYENDPEKAVKALALLERATPDAREIAELSV